MLNPEDFEEDMTVIPAPYNYPSCLPEKSREEKLIIAKEIYREYGITYLPKDLREVCQNDFKLCSLVVYNLVTDAYKECRIKTFDEYPSFWEEFLPVKYCGGNIEYGRVFSINMCSFRSSDSIIGFRNSDVSMPQIYFKILKGLKFIGTIRNWTLFKLDTQNSDDMTAMIYSPLEKNFTIEFAHFPHDGERKILFRWIDC